MAGRGADVRVRLPVTGEELRLTVGLHTPLSIFKAQLAQLTDIAPQHQVLQLLDERAPEERDWRDPDNKLLENGYSTLAQAGLGQDACLSLHSVAPPTPTGAPRQAAVPAATLGAELRALRDASTHTLHTGITPRQADHSFAGVLWDVYAASHCEVTITSVWVGGMLGRVRVYARGGSWKGDGTEHATRLVHTGWGTRYDLDARGWALVADEECAPSWDVAREVRLAQPLRILPHHTRALFVHSSLPDDLGIQYQTYRGTDVIAEDAHVQLLPGLGFTGAVPFDTDTRRGWYRAYRGLAGAVSYTAAPLRWSAPRHSCFSLAARAGVLTMLLAHRRRGCALAALPKDVLLCILEHCHYDWFLADGEAPPRVTAAPHALAAHAAHGLVDTSEDDEDDDDDSASGSGGFSVGPVSFGGHAGNSSDDDDDELDDALTAGAGSGLVYVYADEEEDEEWVP